ncbi:type III secretion system (T3SS) SseB-like protein [Streptomyces sp. Ag109_G2-6]|uniref:SseB family protein n=1 Tax=Streptomyces TaxID=1883 RepID=UPI0009A4981D|nr:MULTISPECIES: SseB family protein [Streptomyces]RPF44666.1 type III secretion system (T3SS) SseB-like protein [Streptomyces sp. Ag109_G2-6]
MELTAEIAAYQAGAGDPGQLLGEFRRAVLLVPLADESAGGLMSAVSGGIRWLYAFTDEESFARFAEARGEAGREWPYLSILGARLVDAVVPEVGGPAGIAVNVADEDGAMLFPPVAGIVPDSCAVDVDNGDQGEA